jgi:hypothetical protein
VLQKRYHISFHPDYIAAHLALKVEKEKVPEFNYQVRKKQTGFELVARLTTTDAERVRAARTDGEERKDPQGYVHRKKRKRRFKDA